MGDSPPESCYSGKIIFLNFRKLDASFICAISDHQLLSELDNIECIQWEQGLYYNEITCRRKKISRRAEVHFPPVFEDRFNLTSGLDLTYLHPSLPATVIRPQGVIKACDKYSAPLPNKKIKTGSAHIGMPAAALHL